MIREFLTAADLDQSAAWNDAATVTSSELQIALASVGPQIPPLSIANAVMRRRWLRSHDIPKGSSDARADRPRAVAGR